MNVPSIKKTLMEEEALFDAARLLTDAAARQAFLDQACGGDTDLRVRIESLLESELEAERFFSDARTSRGEHIVNVGNDAAQNMAEQLSRSSASPPAEVPGTKVGRYKLLQNIGEGGGGVVYMAEQSEPVRRRVALKIIKLGMDTKRVIARFEAERQALAMMDHLNIARVLDAGATETGRPYFVMELVRGVKITEYCDQNNLDTAQRLKLFIQVCNAIQHAHQKGVIHRDIKPSNILVTLHDGVPVPKVIDFGIAKATDAQLTERTLFTAYDQLIGTPAYMSPEQAEMSGLDIDTRTDIYSLGVLLYELLTGRTPFDARKLMQSGIDEMRRTLREREPQKPSTILTTLQNEELTVTARHRHAEPPRLITLLKGDLDWIVMKCLEKDRTRRYETANGLAMDIHRYLNNEPVVARPPSRIYRLQKLVRRNKAVFASGAAVTLVLVCGLAVSTWLFLSERDARREQVRLREVAERARANEAELRQRAEAREKLAQAAVLLSQEKFDDADELVGNLKLTEPSMESASVLRSLGEWHALGDRWQKAGERFAVLLRVNNSVGLDIGSLDQLELGCALVEKRDAEAYERFRRAAIERFSNTSNPVAAERIIKISLLSPPGQDVLRSLSTLADFATQCFRNPEEHGLSEFHVAWGAVSLGLLEYRRGHYELAAEWARRALNSPDANAPRAATAHIILAQALHRLGQKSAASAELEQARLSIDDKFRLGLDIGTANGGFWFDWCFARILLREATASR